MGRSRGRTNPEPENLPECASTPPSAGKELGITRRASLIATAALQYLLLAILAALPAFALGLGLGRVVSGIMLAVQFTIRLDIILVVLSIAVAITAILGAMTIWRAVSTRPALLLRDL